MIVGIIKKGLGTHNTASMSRISGTQCFLCN